MNELVTFENYKLKPTDQSCDWLKQASIEWGGCTPQISYNGTLAYYNSQSNEMEPRQGGFYISSCDDSLYVSFKYCPGCGRELKLVSET